MLIYLFFQPWCWVIALWINVSLETKYFSPISYLHCLVNNLVGTNITHLMVYFYRKQIRLVWWTKWCNLFCSEIAASKTRTVSLVLHVIALTLFFHNLYSIFKSSIDVMKAIQFNSISKGLNTSWGVDFPLSPVVILFLQSVESWLLWNLFLLCPALQ